LPAHKKITSKLISNVGQRRHKKLPKRLYFAGRTQRVHYCIAEAQEGKGYVVLQHAKRPAFGHIVKHFKTKIAAKNWLNKNS
jgi:hypothetical protein